MEGILKVLFKVYKYRREVSLIARRGRLGSAQARLGRDIILLIDQQLGSYSY